MGTDKISKKELRWAIMTAALVIIILLILLSIYGAFLGSQRAQNFFNSPPLSVYWLALTALLIAAFTAFPRLIRLPGLLLIHAGCVLVLAGAIWGSPAAYKIRTHFLKTDKIRSGEMTIVEDQTENRITLENTGLIKELPVSVRLKDFRVEYYKSEYLLLQTPSDRYKFPVEIGTAFPLDPNSGSITIVKVFKNFKITIKDDTRTAVDDPEPGYNPALEVLLEKPDGTTATKYVFERFPGHSHSQDNLLLIYQKIIRDYISDLEVIKDGKVVAEKSIEVNHPLYFGGYHFYQSSYDDDAHKYTVLSVVSNTGMNLVYAGFLMLVIGVFWHFWLRHIFTKRKTKSE
jgi:hypothetical protein